MHSTHLPLPGDLRWRRLIGVALFLALLYALRHLAPVFICFVIFARTLGWLAQLVRRTTGMGRRASVAATLSVFFAVVAGLATLAVVRLVPFLQNVRRDRATYTDMLAHPVLDKLRAFLGEGSEGIATAVKQHAMTAIEYATATAHVGVFIGIGILLGIMYLLDKEEVDGWFAELAPESMAGTLARWFSYVSDAVVVTIRLQVVVAAVNALVTLPVLLALRLPHAFTLFLLLLITGLIPVVGNFIAGIVLCIVAYATRGWGAVACFLAVTAVLHKIEGYVLGPRLAKQHVRLPAVLMIVSLLVFEQFFGFAGLFLSFPALYVAERIFHEWRVGAPPAAVVVAATAAVATAEGAGAASGESRG